MSFKKTRTVLAALAGVAMIPLGIGSALAASQGQINAAIVNGLAYISSQQAADGHFNCSGTCGSYPEATTGAAVYAMLVGQSRGLWGGNAAVYQANVDKGIAYLLSNATTANVTTRNDGAAVCPGGAASCTGVYWYNGGEITYGTGLIPPALALYAFAKPNAVATTSGPLAGMTWSQITQGITNYYAGGQAWSSWPRGGWRYQPYSNDADMSTTQWAVISMIENESLGGTTPAITKTDLKNYWLATDQESGYGGGACYGNDSYGLCDNSDTGGFLLSETFVGAALTDTPVVNALNFLNANWNTTANGWYGNFGHPYAMWADYKGLAATIGLADTATITNLRSGNCGGNSPTPCNWWQDYNDWLVANQKANGSWDGYSYWTDVLASSYYVPILAAAQVIPNICDLNKDGKVSPADIVILTSMLHQTVVPGSLGDFNHDGKITTVDTRACTLQETATTP